MNKEATLSFNPVPYMLQGQLIMRLPDETSKALPSRGQVAVKGRVGNEAFVVVLEPDGNWGHWLRVTDQLQKAGVRANKETHMEIAPTKDWPEPVVPDDFAKGLERAPQKVKEKWADITPMARWEWIRWVNATGNDETRAIRIEKSVSKLNGTHRRPCCFNLAACTDPALSKSGRLIEVS